MATGSAPLRDNEPALARTMVASGQQRIALGERAGEKGRRIGSGVGSAGEGAARKGPRCGRVNGFSLQAHTAIPAHRRDQWVRLLRETGRGAGSLERLPQDVHGDLGARVTRPWADGPTGIQLSPVALLEKLAALVPLPRAPLGRYGGCGAPHRTLRAVLPPSLRPQGVHDAETPTGTPDWHWARLLGRVLELAMAPWPLCRRGSLRIIAAITQASVLPRLLRHLQLASVPPPIAPARRRQERCAFDYAHASVGSEATCAQRRLL